jgi:hypothetical protein
MGAEQYNFEGYRFGVEARVFRKNAVIQRGDFTEFLVVGLAVLPNPSWSGDSYDGDWEAYIIRSRESDFIVVHGVDILNSREAAKIFLHQKGISTEDINWIERIFEAKEEVE